jgi:hypothetical protein
MKNVIRLYYDDDLDSIVSKINDLIKSCGLELIEEDNGDGWIDYKIVIHDQMGEDICE